MSADLAKGLRKVGETQAAVISAQVTEQAIAAKLRAEAELNQSQNI